ncbi:MAG TPA: VOC family protein [Acidimicrobiales bacterium]|nr:VOC family protein [Acidimicrobiales bacterium]
MPFARDEQFPPLSLARGTIFKGVTTIKLGSVSLDCADPKALASFWADLLGGAIAYTSDDFVAVRLDQLWLSTVRVGDYQAPDWPDGSPPQQIHLDLAVDDLDEAELRALSLGARKTEHQPSPDTFRVMLDPAGHPFCLTTGVPD